MIVRIVKITLLTGKRPDFISLFNQVVLSILACEGCIHVELLKDLQNENIVFTLSHWQNEAALQKYRESALFEGTWIQAKRLFSQKAEAWSLEGNGTR